MNRRLLSCVAVATGTALAATACGTAPRPTLGMKEQAANVVYGDNAAPPPPPEPPAANPVPGFPGFIAPPAPRVAEAPPAPGGSGPASAPTSTIPPLPTLAPPPCPEDDPLDVPKDEAKVSVPGPPRTATLPYRQSGSTTVGTTTTPATPTALHKVDGQTVLGPTTFRFNVAITSGTATTVTTYQVDQRGAEDAVSIVQVRTRDGVGTDAFTPSAPITILPLPPVRGRTFRSTGSDPLHQTAMTIYGKVLGKTRVNACGTPLDAWLVEVGPDPQSGQPSRIVERTRSTTIKGTYAVATQFGALVVARDLVLEGTDANERVRIAEPATINRVPARP